MFFSVIEGIGGVIVLGLLMALVLALFRIHLRSVPLRNMALTVDYVVLPFT
jgi:hypothetical protein